MTIFERHLDLAPLHGRRRGLVRCAFHRPDRRGSLSVDLDRGVFNCFTCGAQGGLVRFAELVGEHLTVRRSQPRRESPLQEARRQVLRLARRQDAIAEEWGPYWALNDQLRRRARVVRLAREYATSFGPSDSRTWLLLEHAATVERELFDTEAELDDSWPAGGSRDGA